MISNNSNQDCKKLLQEAIKEIRELADSAKIMDSDFSEDYMTGKRIAFMEVLSRLQTTVILWHPHDTDEEERQVLAEFNLDINPDTYFFGKKHIDGGKS